MKKKIKNECTHTCSDTVGEEIVPVTSAARHKVFLDDFGQATVGNTDDDGKNNSFLPILYSIGYELFAVTP